MSALIDNYSEDELRQIVAQSHSLKEVVEKLGYNTNSGNNGATVKKRLQLYNIDISHFTHSAPVRRSETNVFIENSTASQQTLRRWYKKGEYSEYKCAICGQEPFWKGKELTLILDHIDGNNKDDRLENLRWVCPNCNQQLETTGFHTMRSLELKNQNKKYYCSKCGKEITGASTSGMCISCFNKNRDISPDVEQITRDELKSLIRTTPFTKIAKEYSVSDNAVRRWCDKYGLPRKVSDIKQYSDEEWTKV